MDISDITATDLQDKKIAPIFIKYYREQVTKRMKDDKYMLILAMYVDSIFQDFESFLRTEIDMIEDDIRLALDEYNSSFVSYELQPGIYNFEDISEVLLNLLQTKYEEINNTVVIQFDDITVKVKLVVRPGVIAIKLDEKSIFRTILGFTSGWNYKHYNEYISQKNLNSSTTNKTHLKADVIDGSVVKGIQEPILFSFVLDKPSGYKVFCEAETIH